jgi:hypothetical protein
MAKVKTFIIESARSGGFMSSRPTRYSYAEGTLEYLIGYYSYTLECGASWQYEKGNKKVNRNPKTVAGLVKSLNIATNNSAANGYSGTSYQLVTEKRSE